VAGGGRSSFHIACGSVPVEDGSGYGRRTSFAHSGKRRGLAGFCAATPTGSSATTSARLNRSWTLRKASAAPMVLITGSSRRRARKTTPSTSAAAPSCARWKPRSRRSASRGRCRMHGAPRPARRKVLRTYRTGRFTCGAIVGRPIATDDGQRRLGGADPFPRSAMATKCRSAVRCLSRRARPEWLTCRPTPPSAPGATSLGSDRRP
jgi:hypothetical protein